MAKKIQLQDANGNVLHPLTLGECVAMDNGENLDTLMSKSQVFTPTITQDKSMFKVGTGVDVDYSANVKDGAYESLVFKGKSLVNIHPISYAIGASGATIYFANKDVDKTKIKSGTRYFLRLLDTDPTVCRVYFKPCNVNTISFANINDKYAIFTTKSELTDSDFSNNKIHFYTNTGKTLEDVANTKIILCEYQEGMENWDIPYFTGLCDNKMPILRNVGKNLFDKQRHSNPNNFVVNPSYWSIPIQLKGNTLYNFSYTYDNVHNKQTVLRFATDIWTNPTHSSSPYNLVEVFNTRITSDLIGERGNARFTTPANGLVYLHYYNGELGNSLSSFNIMSWYTELLKDVQLEETPSATTYEDYKTNILRTSEEIVLREVGGVCDTYNPLTGEYAKRIGEVVLDGSEGWGLSGFTNDNYFVAYCQATTNSAKANSKIKCDKIQYDSRVSVIDTVCEGINIIGDKSLRISMSKSRVSNLSDFTSWLQLNPVTIQYELAESVTTIVKPSTMTPFAYQNGHAIVESGVEGQSLLPEIEYGVVTGRTGQVTQNTKVLRRQEQQIIGLEELLLTQIVQMEYERTLLQFDYELQMMKLG